VPPGLDQQNVVGFMAPGFAAQEAEAPAPATEK